MIYDTKITVYKDGTVKQRLYSKPIYRDDDNSSDSKFDDIDSDKSSSKGRQASKENELKEIRKDSLTRSRNIIIDYVLNNPCWVSFITLTFAENITDINKANKCFQNWVDSVRRVSSDFKYIGVPEFQKRGAVHYHILTNIPCNSDIIPLQENETSKYDVKYWKHGFTSSYDLTSADENFNVALYLLKYLYKDLDNRLFGRTKVLKSRNLKKPNTYVMLNSNPKYIQAMEYLRQKKYDVTNIYTLDPVLDNPYVTPFTQIDYKSFQGNNIILNDVLQGNNIDSVIDDEMEF